MQLTCFYSCMYTCQYGHHFVFLIEFASGYALFDAHGMYEYPGFTTTFKIAEKYLNNNPFTLRAFYPFLSVGDALIQMKAICNCKRINEKVTIYIYMYIYIHVYIFSSSIPCVSFT